MNKLKANLLFKIEPNKVATKANEVTQPFAVNDAYPNELN